MKRDRSGSRIDHLNVAVPDLAAAVAFYEPVLASIGITKMLEIPPNATPNQPTAMTGFGLAEVKPYFWLIDGGTVGTNMHLAFTVDTRDDVVTFHRAAPRWRPAPRHCWTRPSIPSTTTTTTAPSCSTRTASTSRRSATAAEPATPGGPR
ncbi:hypothetical protein [Catenuloplanes indicus]|uniref:VOC domain-containing protein n=1 Tax=Catenuloplanes indicus TaxID=137267 RepID=A0AAE4AXZ5_9ACTN|nr:hypothetical protein [Catenuloplanes indicus]MDQ0367590.1 hypothetical protein [Catenuloplanes indicus]